MSDTRGKLPPDADEAERGSYAESTSANPQKNRSNEEFNHNAKAWAMYLQEAEENAKEQAEVWKTGLESLLIFAGLFASVITSFLAESRKKLRLEDSEALLIDIRSALRNETQSDVAYKPTPAQVWVNGLWFTSLLITLFSAIVGVLARSWLVNHLPVSNRKKAKDAHRRWMLDERAERWKLQRVITGIPLLVQVAFFLFSFGLAIQTYDDNKTLGIVVLSLVAGGTLLYLVVTALPLVLPPDSCPFQTPLSEILRGLQAQFLERLRPKGGPEPGDTPEASPDALAKILCKGLIESRKPELADEAAFELSRRPPPSRHLQVFLDSDTPEVCVQRIRDCTSMRFQDSARRDEIIGAHLQALLWLVASWEENGRDEAIEVRFQKLIGRTGVLGRWDFLPESLRALAYAVRVPLYLASGRDFDNISSPGKEWETITRQIQPTYRLSFVISACRGTVRGEQNIQRVSLFTVVHLMMQGYVPVSQGQHTEWNLPNDQDRVRRLCGDYLERLFMSIASTWKEPPKSFLSIPNGRQIPISGAVPPSTPGYDLKPPVFRPPGYPPSNLRYALTSLEAGLRSQGRAILVALAQQGHVGSVQMETFLIDLFDTMFDYSYQPSTVKGSIETAAKITKTHFKGLVVKTLSERIYWALESSDFYQNHESIKRGLEVVDCIISWARRKEYHGIEEAFWNLAPRLIEIDLTARTHPSLKRWQWLVCLFNSLGGDWHKLLQYRERVQKPLGQKLIEVFKFKEGTTGNNHSILDQDERLVSVAELFSCLLSVGPPSMDYLTLYFSTLWEALVPNIANVVSLVLQAASDTVISAGISVLLALSESWYRESASGPWFWSYGTMPSAQTREEVYRTIQTALQGDISHEAPVRFMHLLLAGIKEAQNHAISWNHPNNKLKSDDEAAARSITRTVPQSTGPVVAELLKCFITTRWNDVHAVQLLVDLASEGMYCDAIITCLPKGEDIWNEWQGGSPGAVPLVATLIQSLVTRGWRDGTDLLLHLAINNSCSDSRDGAVKELLFLSNKRDLWETIMNGIKSKIRTSTVDEQDSTVAENWKGLLIVISINATARDFCSFVLQHISNVDSASQDLMPPTKLPQVALPDFIKQVEGFTLHSSMRVRQAALEFLAKIDPPSMIRRLVVLALNDSNECLKQSCLTRLIDIASNVELIPHMITAMKDTVNQEQVDSASDVSWRKKWVTLLKTVSQHGLFTDGLISLLRIARADDLSEVREAAIRSLGELADDQSEAIITRTNLAQSARSTDSNSQVRQAWASTLGQLSKTGRWKQGQDALVDMAFHDYDNNVRHQAYCEIDMLLRAGAEHAASTLASFTDTLERMFRANKYERAYFVYFGTQASPLAFSTDLASAFLHPLIKQVLVDSGVSYFLGGNLDPVAFFASSDHHQAILKCVIENLGSSCPRGAQRAMGLLSRIRKPGHPWRMDPFAACLPALFQHTSKHVRAAAVNLFSIILSTDFDSISSTDVMIPPLVSMALEDFDDGLRNEASELLGIICATDFQSAQREVATLVNVQRFLELLSAPRPLNTTVARLLGVLYQHNNAHEEIGSWIINKVVIPRNIASNLEQGILTLLSELVSRQRLDSSVALDYLLLLLSSSLALKGTPATEPHGPLILTSLSLHYQNEVPDQSSESFRKLTQAFEYAAFGRHGTAAEAKAWLAMEHYLKEQPQQPQSEDAEGEGSSPRHSSMQAFEHAKFGRNRAEAEIEGHGASQLWASKNPYRQQPESSQSQDIQGKATSLRNSSMQELESVAMGRHRTEAESEGRQQPRLSMNPFRQQPQLSQSEDAERGASRHSSTQAFELTALRKYRTEAETEARQPHSKSMNPFRREQPQPPQSQVVEDEESVSRMASIATTQFGQTHFQQRHHCFASTPSMAHHPRPRQKGSDSYLSAPDKSH
ncbi:hypothetical protein BKA70DRAFT_848241 [Coprinopsis sp. MPI-PUGE-AT-0042]|nr:hypothetical protein BKA70DRAFT_848241 [Coprinopsis sp. MPI-PUGE-AT-0042]